MSNYFIRSVYEDDYKSIAAIYNSNRQFLLHHLGVERVDETFAAEEFISMCKVGFHSCVIVDRENSMIQGILDYKPGQEVYLSLIMIAADLQGKGVGCKIYSDFELQMLQAGSTSIRIDVVNDYPDNVVPFWENLGFIEGETVTLDWGNKKSKAVVMRKII